MDAKTVKTILKDTAFPRFGGSQEEKKVADYIACRCKELGLSPVTEAFSVPVYETKREELIFNGKTVSCHGYLGTANGTVEAPLYYLRDRDDWSLKGCRDRVVLSDFPVGLTLHEKLVKNGALGVITHSHNPHYGKKDLGFREYRFEGEKLPALHIATADALKLAKKEGGSVRMTLLQERKEGFSHNVICDLEGETDETVVVCAHYDSTANSLGSYDNMSSAIALFFLAEYFQKTAHLRRIRLLWCGSEERGLLGSKAYVEAHQREGNPVLNINLDMLGTVMGSFRLYSCINEEMEQYLTRFLKRHKVGGKVFYAIRSSDSNSFLYHGIPAVSFARSTPEGMFPIHTCYDTPDAISPKRLMGDMRIIAKFTREMANCKTFPLSMEISSKIREDVEKYMNVNRKKEE